MKSTALIFSLLIALFLSSCTTQSVSKFPSHKMTIKQGNELNPEAVRQLRPGLTRAQVRALMGTPMLTDVFHQNRWDYIYQTTRNGIILNEKKQLTIYFDGDVVKDIEGDALSHIQSEQNKE